MKFIGVAKGTPVTVDNEAIKAAGLQLSYTPEEIVLQLQNSISD